MGVRADKLSHTYQLCRFHRRKFESDIFTEASVGAGDDNRLASEIHIRFGEICSKTLESAVPDVTHTVDVERMKGGSEFTGSPVVEWIDTNVIVQVGTKPRRGSLYRIARWRQWIAGGGRLNGELYEPRHVVSRLVTCTPVI
jgi:hypothetical protein